MKATIERDTLLAALGGVRMVSARRGEIPILSHVLIQASKGKLQFRATNLDQTITETVPTVDLQGGVVSTAVVPAHGLYNIIKETPMGSQAEIEIVTHKGVDTLVVRAGRSRFVLPTLPANDYPTMPKVKMLCSFALPSAELHDLLKPIRHAISTEETRYYLNGVFLTAIAGGTALRAVATDGHRLALSDSGAPTSWDGDLPDSIIPKKAVHIIYNLAGEHDGEIEVKVSSEWISFALGPTMLTTRLVDGSYPDYERVIPKENSIIMRADRSQLAAVIKRISKTICDRQAKLHFALAKGSLTVSTSDFEGGEASEETEVIYKGQPFEIGFNASYLADIFGTMAGPEVEFQMASAVDPTVIRDPANASVLYVLMPMAIWNASNER